MPRYGPLASTLTNWSIIREQAKVWRVSVMNYTASAVIFIIWLCDWKVVCKRVPFYGSKYDRGTPRKYSHY
ncbi:hypothetical protein QLX08_001963 [Tetragonisca angustula]|uniref:Uncharacterized protein n=1 Tax=Tetragonisca angustula TaxID=166442 RepID=A0AAW1ADM3_9HYME